MREKAKFTDEARSLVRKILIDCRSGNILDRNEALLAVKKVKILYGRDVLEQVEQELGEEFSSDQFAVDDPSVVYE